MRSSQGRALRGWRDTLWMVRRARGRHVRVASTSAVAAPGPSRLTAMPAFRAPRGTRDLLPADRALFDRLERHGADLAARYGYRPIETPMFEQTAVFERGIGEVTDVVEKELFRIAPRTEEAESWALRPEPTAGHRPRLRAARHADAAAAGEADADRADVPLRPARRPAATASSGSSTSRRSATPGPAIDAEIIELGHAVLRGGRVEGVEVLLNSIGDADLPAGLHRGADRRTTAATSRTCRRLERDRLERNALRLLDSKDPAMAALNAAAPRITDRLCEACAEHFEAVRAHLTRSACRGGSSPASSAASTTTRGRRSSSTSPGARASSRRWVAAAATTGSSSCWAAGRRPGIGFGLGLDRRRARPGESRGAPSTPSRARWPSSSARIPRHGLAPQDRDGPARGGDAVRADLAAASSGDSSRRPARTAPTSR